MEDTRFDAVSKRLGTAQLTRGGLLRGVFGAAAAAVAGAVLASGEADARKKKRKKGKKGKADKAGRTTVAGPTILPPGHSQCRQDGHPCEGNQVCCSGVCEVTGPGKAKRCVGDGPCGASGQQCCAGKTCDEGLECKGNTCKPINPECGALDQPCCPEGPECQGGLTCDESSNTCQPVNPECGGSGQPCCEQGVPCQGGLVCDDEADICVPVPCGGAGEICCENDTCDGDLICSETGFCIVPCGAENQVCCDENICDEGLDCQGGECVVPTVCGGDGEVCCAGGECDPGLTCNGTTCESSTPAGGCTSNTDCPAGSVCSIDGSCVSFGIACKSGETAEQCCNRSVKKGCKRKQQSGHARKNCLKKGKRRCRSLLGGV